LQTNPNKKVFKKSFDRRTKARFDPMTAELLALPDRPNGGRRYARLVSRVDPKLSCRHVFQGFGIEVQCKMCSSSAIFEMTPTGPALVEYTHISILMEEARKSETEPSRFD
jgi:hypothetical protein